ncbi:MAG: hypothetical protein RLZZ450_6774 [Pseudomonadota bacterium]
MTVRSLRNTKETAPTATGWEVGLILNDEGAPKRCLANVLHVMSQHPQWSRVLAYNAFTECVEKTAPPPVRQQDGVSQVGEWNEADSTRTAAWFASVIGFEPATTQVDQAVAAAAERRVVHPIRDYLLECEWDGIARLDTLLAVYFGARDTPYTRQIGARWMISAAARAMEPGCQVDCMLVLESDKQGIGKSTGFEALFGRQWFADTGIHIGEKDSYQSLRGKWGYEWGELDSMKGREVTRVKSFVSARSDNYRPSYGRKNRDFPRQVVFCGTTNESEYLNDTSGGRRFWPVRCERVVDVAAIRRDRDQLWAEARRRYQDGSPWHVDTAELRELCEVEQSKRQIEDPWTGIISTWLSEQPSRAAGWPGEGITTADVLSGPLKLAAGHMHHGLVTRVGHILRQLGWSARQLRRDGGRVRLYLPLSHPSHDNAEIGSDVQCPDNMTQYNLSHPSQPDVYVHEEREWGERSTNGNKCRDGRDAVTADDPDQLEREAIAAEGRGEV